jgi:hypothetical protein
MLYCSISIHERFSDVATEPLEMLPEGPNSAHFRAMGTAGLGLQGLCEYVTEQAFRGWEALA